MVEYCEIFKMAFSKIQDFLRRPKALKLLQDISYDFSYPIFNFADTLTTVRRGKHWTVSLTGTNDGDGIHFFKFF